MRYTWYENYPDNRLIVGGVDLSVTYRMILSDGYTLGVPEAKTYTVDIPGGDGVIDLTESLIGDTVYNNRTQEFTFYIIDQQNQTDFENVKTDVSNYLNGKAFDYILTWDPEYIYHGRFHVSSYEHEGFPTGILGAIKITVDADPYKSKGMQTYTLNATGGKQYEFTSGRKKVHPILTCTEPCKVNFNGTSLTVPSGTYRLNPVLFEEGVNELYLNSHQIQCLTWDDIGEDGMFALLWATPTVTSIKTTYSSSSSGSAIPGSFSSTYPSSGTYIWTRVITTYSNGVKTYSYSVEYTEWEEPDEEDSESSVETTSYYTSSDSGTTIPSDTSWLYYDVIGAWLDAETEQFSYVYLFADTDEYLVFLWKRIETTYSDGTSTLVYQVTQESTYGDDYTTDVSYQASLDGTTVPDGTWSTEYPITTDYPYIWTKTVYTYSSTGYTSTSYDVDYILVDNIIYVNDSVREYSYVYLNLDDVITDSDGNDILDSDEEQLNNSTNTISYDLADHYDELNWVEEMPELDDADDYVIFSRDIDYYSDNTVCVSYSIMDIALGYDVSEINNYYFVSDDGKTIPDNSSDWSEEELETDDILWTRTKTVYENDYAIYTYSSDYISAVDITTDMIYVTDVDTKYQYSSDPDILTAMSTGRFEWVKTVTEYSDGGKTTEYTCTYNAESIGADQYRWDELHLLYNGLAAYKRTWEDISSYTWSDISGYGDYSITWDSLDYRDADIPDTYVTLQYEWKDL